ncbi:MAG TPA: hypothetical protein VF271_09390 [Rhodanobacteraceae bacterium]
MDCSALAALAGLPWMCRFCAGLTASFRVGSATGSTGAKLPEAGAAAEAAAREVDAVPVVVPAHAIGLVARAMERVKARIFMVNLVASSKTDDVGGAAGVHVLEGGWRVHVHQDAASADRVAGFCHDGVTRRRGGARPAVSAKVSADTGTCCLLMHNIL